MRYKKIEEKCEKILIFWKIVITFSDKFLVYGDFCNYNQKQI